MHKEVDLKDKEFISWLCRLPYYPGGRGYENHRLYNMTILVDAPYVAYRQGDIDLYVLNAIRERNTKRTLYVFNERSDLVHDEVFSPPQQKKADPKSYEDAADFILKPDGTAIVISHDWPGSASGTAKLLDKAGYVVTQRDVLPNWMTKPTKEVFRGSKIQ